MLFARVVEDALTRFQLHERGDAPLMRQPAPMLLGRAKELFDHPDWTYEVIAINERVQPDFEALQPRPRPRNGAVLRHAVLKGIRPDQPARQVVQSPQLRRGSL